MLYELGTGLARLQFSLFARWTVEGRESVPPRGPIIIASNHLSNADPPLVVASFKRKLHCLAKEGLFENPISSWFFTRCHAHPIRQGREERKALRWALNVLDRDGALVVFPEGRDNRSLKESRVIRTDPEHPVPEMVIEVVSPTSVVRDYEEKAFLYERLGIREYLIVDPGEPPTENHSGYDFQIVLHRMQDDGTYARVPGVGPEANRTVRSEVLGVLLRLTQADSEGKLIFQWYDADLDIWRDHIGDGLRESAARGEARGRLGVVLDLLEPVLPNKTAYDELREAWASSGLPENVAEMIPAVLANPGQWRELLGPASKDGNETKPPL